METKVLQLKLTFAAKTLYSLEKLIEWKLTSLALSVNGPRYFALYSLEKLIEWKRMT